MPSANLGQASEEQRVQRGLLHFGERLQQEVHPWLLQLLRPCLHALQHA